MFGKFIEILELTERGLESEQKIGISIVTLILFIIALKSAKKRSGSLSDILVYSGGVAVLFAMLFTLKLGSNGISLWYIIYKIVPGASSLRAIDRFIAFLVLPMAIFISVCLGKVKQTPKAASKIAFFRKLEVAILSILIFVSDMRIVDVIHAWSSDERLDIISQTADVPENAECFYIVDTSGKIDSTFINQLNAYVNFMECAKMILLMMLMD